MTGHSGAGVASTGQLCTSCSKPLTPGGEFCPFCGTKAVPSLATPTIDAYVQNKIAQELSTRLADQKSLVRELSDQAEDVLWARFKRYAVLVGVCITVILGFLTFAGVTTLDGVSNRIEPLVSAAEQRVKTAKSTIDETATKAESVKAALDKLSLDVDALTKRVADKGGEIFHKLDDFDAIATEAQKKGESFQTRIDELSARLDTMIKALESRVQQVSKQVDNLTIRQVYPTVGEQKFVTLNGIRIEDKKENEKRINVYIYPYSMGDFTPQEIETLIAVLKEFGTPMLGSVGIGGPFSTGFGPLGATGNESVLFYFQQSSAKIASDVAAAAAKVLANTALNTQYVGPADTNQNARWVIENSGLDLQLFLYRSPK